jgi:hypothetical protein
MLLLQLGLPEAACCALGAELFCILLEFFFSCPILFYYRTSVELTAGLYPVISSVSGPLAFASEKDAAARPLRGCAPRDRRGILS